MDLESIINRFMQIASESLPKIAGATIALFLGWVFGRLIGRALASIIRRLGIEESFNRTVLGRALKKSNITLSHIVNLLTRWFIYLAAILLASDILGATTFSSFIRSVMGYIPYLMAGFLIITLGFIITDFIGNTISALGEELGLSFSNVFTFFTKLLLGFAVVVIALTVMKVDVSIFYIFANALAWGIAGALALGLGIAIGWGFKDMIAKNAETIVRNLGLTFSKVSETATTEALREKISRLEGKLKEYRERIETMEKERAETVAFLEETLRPIPNLDERLKEIIGTTGEMTSVSGGYEIEIKDPINFPWCPVIFMLQNQGFNVWFSKRDNRYFIMAKP